VKIAWRYLFVVAALILTTGCADRALPEHPFDHALMNENSQAVPVPNRGEVGQIVAGLESVGFFCAQVRVNDTSAQVWCQVADDSDPNGHPGAEDVVNMIITREGVVQYADIDAPELKNRDLGTRLREVLEVSFWSVWPDDASKVDKAISDVQREPDMFFGHDDDQPQGKTLNTSNARYVVAEGGSGILLSLTTSAVRDHSWPYTGDGYATTTRAAEPGLLLGGFDCGNPMRSLCKRGLYTNQQITFTTNRDRLLPGDPDQVLTVQMFIPGTSDPADLEDLTAVGFPNGLSFLTAAAAGPVEEQIIASRRTGKSFVGIEGGAVVIIDAPLDPPSGLTGPYPVDVTFGIKPLDRPYPE
jgi:hypothetical protein